MLAIWDNSATQHFAINDYPGERRELFRTSVAGTEPQPASVTPYTGGQAPFVTSGGGVTLRRPSVSVAADSRAVQSSVRRRSACGGSQPVGDDDAFDHVGDHRAAGTTLQPDRHDRAVGPATDRSVDTDEPRRAPEARPDQPSPPAPLG